MPRQARKKSSTGIYHIILRGINRQIIFEDDEDKEKYLETVKKYKQKSEYKVLGYCLMDNHIHLLIQEGKDPLKTIMKRIGVSYVYWYNWKYRRTGHLFQDRFKSEPIEDEAYLLMVLRYIHQNPINAGMVNNLQAYKWSSYNEYIEHPKMIDADLVSGIFSNNKHKLEEYLNEGQKITGVTILDSKESNRLVDTEARRIIEKAIGSTSLEQISQIDKSRRDEILRSLKHIESLSIRQIARITGFTVNVVAKA